MTDKKNANSSEIPKVTNGHLRAKVNKKTIEFTWGKYSITIICLTTVAVAFIQKINF